MNTTRRVQWLILSLTALVWVAPLNGQETPPVTHLRTTYSSASGEISGETFFAHFNAQVGYDFGLWGSLDASMYDYSTDTYQYISCFGPAYANILSVNRINGDTTINATLDPSSSDCSAVNVSAPIVIQLVGKGRDQATKIGTGRFTEETSGVTYKYSFQSSEFYETFAGTNGFYLGTFTGGAFTEQRNSLERGN
jgi:hypothetical protein